MDRLRAVCVSQGDDDMTTYTRTNGVPHYTHHAQPWAPKPYRAIVSARGYRRGRTYKGRGKHNRGAYSAIEPITYAYVAWTADQTAEPGRLEGSGTFLFAGLHRIRAAAMAALALPATTQVSIRTNQDRTLYVFNKHADGRITGYDARER